MIIAPIRLFSFLKQSNLLLLFYNELKEMYTNSPHKRTQAETETILVIGYLKVNGKLIVWFSNGSVQIIVSDSRFKIPIEILIEQKLVRAFNGKQYVSFNHDTVPTDLKNLIQDVIDSSKKK